MENNLVMENSWKIGKQNKFMEVENILKKQCNLSAVYHESSPKISDNSISTGLLQ